MGCESRREKTELERDKRCGGTGIGADHQGPGLSAVFTENRTRQTRLVAAWSVDRTHRVCSQNHKTILHPAEHQTGCDEGLKLNSIPNKKSCSLLHIRFKNWDLKSRKTGQRQ